MAPPESPMPDPLQLDRESSPAAHRLTIRLIFGIFAVCLIVFMAFTAYDVLMSAVAWHDLRGTSSMGRTFASTVSRAYNVIFSMVVSAIAIAIPLTANLYTPKLVEIFVKDRYTVGVLAFFVFSCMHAIWADFLTWDGPAGSPGLWAVSNMYAILVEMLLGFSIMIPYLYYASGFLNPSIIIHRVTGQILDEIEEIERGGQDVHAAQRRLAQKILHLGNVILRAVDRADRDVAIEAIRAVRRVMVRYHEAKPKLAPEWFTVGTDILTGLSPEAVEFVSRDRNWVMHRCLTQLSLAFNAALAKMPDAVSAISEALRDIAVEANERRDGPVVALAIRFMNTFLREAVKKKDMHAIYDLFAQYKSLVFALMGSRPELVPEVGRYFKYYAEFARASGMPFAYELASYELGDMVRRACDGEVPTWRDLLEVMLSLEGAGASARLVKSRAIAWAALSARGAPEAARVRSSLLSAPAALLESARQDILGTKEPMFWEVTDRQANFDYVDERGKAATRELFDGLIRESRGEALAARVA